jgi:hypothetical protein
MGRWDKSGKRFGAIMAGCALAALAQPLGAQTNSSATGTAAGTPAPADATGQAAPKPAVKVTPQQVIDVFNKVVKPRPQPAPAPTYSYTPPVTPTAVPTQSPAPRPTAVATSAPRQAAVPSPAATRPTPGVVPPVIRPPAPAPSDDAVVPTQAPEPVVQTAAPEPPPEPDLIAIPQQPMRIPWAPLAALAAALAAAGYGASRWFFPKLALDCEIEVGPDALAGSSKPLIQQPELQFALSIEAGEPGAPSGAILAAGDSA